MVLGRFKLLIHYCIYVLLLKFHLYKIILVSCNSSQSLVVHSYYTSHMQERKLKKDYIHFNLYVALLSPNIAKHFQYCEDKKDESEISVVILRRGQNYFLMVFLKMYVEQTSISDIFEFYQAIKQFIFSCHLFIMSTLKNSLLSPYV